MRLLLLLFITLGSISPAVLAQAAQNDPENPELVAFGTMQNALDAANTIAANSMLPIPPGALDGAKETDLMYQVLKMIFGQPLANITAYTTNRDSSADESNPVQNVNVIVYLFSLMAGIGLLGTLIASVYTILESLVSINTSAKLFSNSGNEGSPFAFLISRMGISSIVNVPIPAAGGMALSQVLMLFTALLGIGLASSLFYVVATRMINQPLITFTSIKTEEFFVNISQAVMCLDYLEANGFIEGRNNTIVVSEMVLQKPVTVGFYSGGGAPRPTVPQPTTVVKFGQNGECGQFSYRHLVRDPSSNDDQNGTFSFLTNLFSSSGDNVEDSINYFLKPAALEVITEMLNSTDFRMSLRSLAIQSYSADGFKPDANTVNNYSRSYTTFKQNISNIFYRLDELVNECPNGTEPVVGGSASSIGCSNEAIKQSIAKYGFMLAGTYSYILNSRQSVISDALENAVPKFRYENKDVLERFSIDEKSPYYTDYLNNANKLSSVYATIATTTTSSLAADLNKLYESTTSDSGFVETLGDALYTAMRGVVKVGYMGQNASYQNPEPITQLAQMGNIMMATPFIILGADALISGVIKLTPVGLLTGAKKAGGAIGKSDKRGIFGMVLGMLVAAAMQAIVVGGFFLAVFVPAIPYVMWNMAIFGYIGYVILCVIGVPIMIAAKPLRDGDGFVGGVKTGYMMAFNLFIRPSAMVIGLVVAMVLSRIFSWIINATYFESIQIAYSNGFNLAAVFGVPLMYAIIQLTAIYKAYSMINEVPAFIGKMTETDRANSDFGEEGERNRVGGLFVQGGNSAMGGMHSMRNRKGMMASAPAS